MEEVRAQAAALLANNHVADPRDRIKRALHIPLSSLDQLVTRYTTGQKDGHYGFLVPNTIAMAYDVFIAAGGDYRNAVWLAVNLGGDTDSIASIAGSMCNAWSCGDSTLPEDFDHVVQYAHLDKLSRQFAQKAMRLL
jgi:ADP-ribosylglycohydrolase